MSPLEICLIISVCLLLFIVLVLSLLLTKNKRKVKKCFEYANKENIKYVIVVGSNEIESNTYTIKNMLDGTQTSMNEEELLKYLK